MAVVDIPLIFTKDDLLAELESRRPAAERADAKALDEHRKAEDAWLDAFHKAAEKATRMTYKQAKETGGYLPIKVRRAPSCPRSQVSALDSLIAMVQKINQPKLTITRNGRWERIYAFLTEDVPKVKGLC